MLTSIQAPQTTNPANAPKASGIPTRGGTANRGRGGVYQATRGGAAAGRGRGANPGPRGGMNAAATTFSPSGPAGIKRPREEGSIGGPQQGNGGKRPRGGGQNS